MPQLPQLIFPQLISVWYSFLQYLAIFLESSKKVVHKNFTKSTENHLNRVPLCNKAAGWRYADLLNRKFGTGALLQISEIFKNIYFENARVDKIRSRHPNFQHNNFAKLLKFLNQSTLPTIFVKSIIMDVWGVLMTSLTCSG